MASEYLKWKYRNEKAPERRELSPEEKRRNWWHYHWKLVALAAVGLLILCDLAVHALHTRLNRPGLQIAYVGETRLPEDTVQALEQAFSRLAEESTGSPMTVRVNQYPRGNDQAGDAAAYASAGSVRLLGDLESCDSFLFLLDDAETFQADYQILSRLDGSLPDPSARSYEDCYLRWEESPALASLDLGSYQDVVLGEKVTGRNQDLVKPLYLARRGFWFDKTVARITDCETLWQFLLKGVL